MGYCRINKASKQQQQKQKTEPSLSCVYIEKNLKRLERTHIVYFFTDILKILYTIVLQYFQVTRYRS